MHRSDPESEHFEQYSDDIPMQDEGHVLDLEDTDNAHIPKESTTVWFKPILESERPATPEPEWTIPPNDFPEPENNWVDEGPAFNLVKDFHLYEYNKGMETRKWSEDDKRRSKDFITTIEKRL
ncbi:hypothetical protein Tco_0391480, partial [Tanacetum coccineum]